MIVLLVCSSTVKKADRSKMLKIVKLPSTSPRPSYQAASLHTLTFKIKNPNSYMISLFFCFV